MWKKKLPPIGENGELTPYHTEIYLNYVCQTQMPLRIRHIAQLNTVCWEEIEAFPFKED